MNIAVCVKQVPDTATEREGSGALGMAGVGASSDASLKLWAWPIPGNVGTLEQNTAQRAVTLTIWGL
jgi:hypothetical protein